ncbi:MAG: 2,3-bisphosphoglycerate-independent phosphoglycerate mutase [Planctomycetota bacterium]|nr:2,3-bisphosphoglycerate-independent phosphoglycerate mutase [Planctomycetota bacterium]
MKYVIIIPDGAADLPLDELGGRTPFQAASMPNLQALARAGRVGTAVTTPPGWEAGSDVCSMSLLGYDPRRYHTGRAPLEAAALNIQSAENDWIFRLNLVTTGGGSDGEASHGPLMLDHSAGAVTSAEARLLVADLMSHWSRVCPDASRGVELHPGVSYRNIMMHRGVSAGYEKLVTTPPHAVPGEPWKSYLPSGPDAAAVGRLRTLIETSAAFLPGHEVNRARIASGLRPASMAWIWGQGTRPQVPSFQERFGLRGAMITSVDLLAGIASFLGWDRLDVPGLTSYHDTDYAAQGRATCTAIARYDVVCSHVESPDEASHQGDWQTKVAALEAIDREIIAPVWRELEQLDDTSQQGERRAGKPGWRLLVMPDHFTLVSTRKHDATPVPFLIAGTRMRALVPRGFDEDSAAESDLRVEEGHELMEYFLRGNQAGVR